MFTKIFTRFQEPTYLLLRLFSGFLFSCHGFQKLLGWMGGEVRSQPLMIAAGVIELVGGLAIALGLLTPLVAFLSAGQMAVAYLMAHASRDFWPIQNGGELALVYMCIFLFLMTKGSGPWSLDAILFKRVETAE